MSKEMSKEEQIGFHKGALDTLLKEREEFTKVLNIVNSYIENHVNALNELGVDLNKSKEENETTSESEDKNIEDLMDI
ncbi:MAG: hypothetical protein ACOCP4_00205 [Candidatus Woesearchaeota archaeon]